MMSAWGVWGPGHPTLHGEAAGAPSGVCGDSLGSSSSRFISRHVGETLCTLVSSGKWPSCLWGQINGTASRRPAGQPACTGRRRLLAGWRGGKWLRGPTLDSAAFPKHPHPHGNSQDRLSSPTPGDELAQPAEAAGCTSSHSSRLPGSR